MKTLTIKDLPASEELGAKEMSAVRGGFLDFPIMGWGDYSDSSVKSFSATGQINQGQNVQTGVNQGVAVLGGVASPPVSVTATQNANITNNVMF